MNLNRPEIIEAYLRGNLSHTERLAFEAQMEQDPLIQSEMELQKDIINSLKQYRKAELKARLSNIEVGTSASSFSAVKIAASIVVTALLSYGTYYLINSGEETTTAVNKNITDTVANVVEPQIAEPKEVVSEAEVKEQSPEIGSNVGTEAYEKRTIKKKGESITEENIITPNVTDSFNENAPLLADKELDESLKPSLVATERITDIEILNEDKKGNELKYKYLNKKLYLYGDFGASPYELLEFNTSSNGKRLFLYHNGAYYLLDENQKIITSLKALKDSEKLRELDSLREIK